MFKDLKEYQEITRIYNESVNISEEQRAINKIFLEEGFTLEEIEYLEENWDELWENELAQFTQECIVESFEGQNLTEEQIQQIDEVLGLKMLAKGITKAAPAVSKGLRSANVGIKKGLRSVGKTLSGGIKKLGTGIKDTASGALSVGKSALKKVGGVIKKAAPIIGKGALLGTGAALPIAGTMMGVNALRNIGKKNREANTQTNTNTTAGEKAGEAGAQALKDKITTVDQKSGGEKAGEAGAQALKDKIKTVDQKTDTKSSPDIDKIASTPSSEIKKSGKTSMIKKNIDRFGKDRVQHLQDKQKDFKLMRSKKMSKDEFINKYPNSITAQRSKGLRDHAEWDAYDMVLEYLISTEQVTSLEEANYVMMEMDQETIGSIVNEVTYLLDEGLIDNLKSGFNKVKTTASNLKDKVVSKGKEVISNVKNKVDVAQKTINPASKENKKIREKQAIQKDASSSVKEKQVAKSQEGAYKRKRANKSIADVKAENKAAMIARAKEKHKAFLANKNKK